MQRIGTAWHLSGACLSANSMSMNLQHAAALALVGWYLMVPPLQNSVFGCDPNAPLRKRLKFRSFDSETACKDRLDQMQGEEKNDPDPFHCRIKHSICVATDDPRLKEK
jgi:hypothetical protein